MTNSGNYMFCALSSKNGVASTTRSQLSGFFPGRSTLQPLFILTHSSYFKTLFILRHLQPSNYKQAHHDCMLLSLTSSRPTIPYPETNFGNNYADVTCLTIYSPSSKTCITKMSTHCWMGTSKQVCSQSLCEARLSPLPPAFFHLLEWCWQSGWRGTGRTYWYSKFCCPITAVCWWPLSAVQCPWPAANLSTASEFMPTGNLWRWTHTNLRWCASNPGLITDCLLSIMTARNYPTPTHSNTWAWCVTKISIWPLRLMQRWDPSQLAISESKGLFKRMSLPTGFMLTSGSQKTVQFLLAFTRARSGQLLS